MIKKTKSKRLRILIACVIATLGLHLCALFIFYTHPLLLHPYLNSILPKTSSSVVIPAPDQEEIAEVEHEQELEDFFREIIPINQVPSDLAFSPYKEMNFPYQEGTTLSFSPFEKSDDYKEHFLTDILSALPDIVIPKDSSASLITPSSFALSSLIELGKHLHIENSEEQVLGISPTELGEDDNVLAMSAKKEEEVLYSLEDGISLMRKAESIQDTAQAVPQLRVDAESYAALNQNEINLKERSSTQLFSPMDIEELAKTEKKAILQSSLPEAQVYGFPPPPKMEEKDDEFNIDVAVVPDEENGRYIFSLTLAANMDKSSEKMKQNIYFLIDRSSSVGKHHYAGFKRSVLRALSSLKENDTFNVFIFDKKVVCLSEENLTFSKKSLKIAQEFLEKQQHGTIFSGSDLHSSLEKILPSSSLPEDEINTVILLSDGKSSLKSHKQQKAIHAWIKKNKGRVTLYTAACGQGNNLVLLDLLATASGGQLMYSDTHAGFPRKLAKLVINLKEPIAKEIMVSASDTKSHIVFYPSSFPMNPLFNSKPYTIVGTINELSDFTLFLRARNKDKLFTIKKQITFQGAKKGGKSLEKLWAIQQANRSYEDFLSDGKIASYQEAKKILAPHVSFTIK